MVWTFSIAHVSICRVKGSVPSFIMVNCLGAPTCNDTCNNLVGEVSSHVNPGHAHHQLHHGHQHPQARLQEPDEMLSVSGEAKGSERNDGINTLTCTAKGGTVFLLQQRAVLLSSRTRHQLHPWRDPRGFLQAETPAHDFSKVQ